MGVGGKRHTLAALPPGKIRHLLYRLGGPHGRSGRVQKISPPTRILSPELPARSEFLTWPHIYIYSMHKGAQLKFKPKHTGT
jgi:hypothetical protein